MRLKELGAILLAIAVVVGVPPAAVAYERSLREPDEITVIARQTENGGWSPSTIAVKKGELVKLRITSYDVVHSLYIPKLDLDSGPIYPGHWVHMEFTVPDEGELRFKCDIACGLLHAKMSAKFVVGNGTAVAAGPTPEPVVTTPPAGASAPAEASAPAASPTPNADAVVALGKKVWETAGGDGCQDCHGADAKGRSTRSGTNAPNVRGATEQKLREALAGGAALMTFLKLTDEEIDAVLRYLQYLDQQ